MSWCDFGLNNRYGHGEETNTKSLNTATSDEDANVGSEYLKESSDEAKEGTKTHGSATTHRITDTCRCDGSEEGGDVEAGDGQA